MPIYRVYFKRILKRTVEVDEAAATTIEARDKREAARAARVLCRNADLDWACGSESRVVLDDEIIRQPSVASVDRLVVSRAAFTAKEILESEGKK